jgi:hypothetical protein
MSRYEWLVTIAFRRKTSGPSYAFSLSQLIFTWSENIKCAFVKKADM